MRAHLIAASLLTAACGADPVAAPPPPPAAVATSATFPTPYTAEQLRDATALGRTYVFRVEIPGKPTVVRSMKFTRIDASGAEVTSTVKDESGTVLETQPPNSMTWEELRKHAEFPRDRVSTTEEEITVPAGRFRCVVYTVHGEDGETDRYYFAKDQPGAPVLFWTEKAGVRVTTNTLIELIRGADAPAQAANAPKVP